MASLEQPPKCQEYSQELYLKKNSMNFTKVPKLQWKNEELIMIKKMMAALEDGGRKQRKE